MNEAEAYLFNEITRLEIQIFNLKKENASLKAEINIRSKGSDGSERTKEHQSGNKQEHD